MEMKDDSKMCEACKRYPQQPGDPARLRQACRGIFSRADYKASSFHEIRADMRAMGIPTGFGADGKG